MPSIIGIVLYAVMAAAMAGFAYKAWSGFTDSIGRPYAEAQRKLDQPKVDAAEAKVADAEQRAKNAQADTASCVASSKNQSDAVKAADEKAARAQAESKAIREAAARDAMKSDAERRRLQAAAAAKPVVDQSCEDARSKTDANLRPTLRDRQGAK